MDTEPTAAIIEAAANRLEGAAAELRRTAQRIRDTGMLDEAADAVNTLAHLPGQCRMDLMVTRPLRAVRQGD